MLTLLTLFGLLLAGVICLVAFIVVAMIAKTLVHVIFWPLKILFLPFLLIALVIKLALVLAFLGVVVAVLIPLAILALLFVGPFLLVSALI